MYRKTCAAWSAALAVVFAAAAGGCQGLNNTQNGALVGSGIGAVTGAIIGDHSGHAGGGAAIGALAGGLGGALIGNAQDAQEQRDAAIAQAHYAQQQRQAAATALRNADLVKYAQNGIGDDVIIQSVRTRGGQFDLSPDAIIALKQSGVSDRVLLEVQRMGEAAPTTVVPAGGPPAVIAPPPPQVVVVRPQPAVRFGVVVGPRPYRRGWHRHWHHW